MNKKEWIANKPVRIRRLRISELKMLLNESDYKAIKYAEGLIPESEYEPIKSERQRYREEINQLESEISKYIKEIEVTANE